MKVEVNPLNTRQEFFDTSSGSQNEAFRSEGNTRPPDSDYPAWHDTSNIPSSREVTLAEKMSLLIEN